MKAKYKLEKFLSGGTAKRLLNLLYSWGAAIVILGALFKLTHIRYGDLMLFVGMITEFFVFFISGLERPPREYKWENVFPQLQAKNAEEIRDIEEQCQQLAKKVTIAQNGIQSYDLSNNQKLFEDTNFASNTDGGNAFSSIHVNSEFISEDQVEQLREGIQNLTISIQRMEQISSLSSTMFDELHHLVESATRVQTHSGNFENQVNEMSDNLSKLNSIYAQQIDGINAQVDYINSINSGLSHIAKIYESSLQDSHVFKVENEHLARQLSQLNMVYARLLDALTSQHGFSPNSNYYSSSPRQRENNDYQRGGYRENYQDSEVYQKNLNNHSEKPSSAE